MMTLEIEAIDQLQVTVPGAALDQAVRFSVRDPGGNRIEIARRGVLKREGSAAKDGL